MPVANTTVSDRKLAANRANAQKSTGPRTAEGKAKVSMNALTHGLTAAMVVLPGEDAAAFEAMRLGWFEDWNPPTEARRSLVERAAADAWRLRRAVKVERDRIAERMNGAVAAYDDRVAARVNDGLRLFMTNPHKALESLMQEHEGVVTLIRHWESLVKALHFPPAWTEARYHTRLLNLLGHPGDANAHDFGHAVMASLRLLLWNRPDLGECDESVDDEAEASRLAALMHDFFAERIAELTDRLADFPDPDLVRSRIADSVAFDVSREGIALQRHEGQLDRSFRANLNMLIKLTRTGEDLIAEATESTQQNKATEPTPVEQNKATETPATVQNKPTEARSTAESPIEAAGFPLPGDPRAAETVVYGVETALLISA